MKPLLNLEEFVDPAAAQIEEAEAEGDAAEQGRLAAYEQGYAAGWEDAAARWATSRRSSVRIWRATSQLLP